eukprot:13134-Pelagomonas_calceolata.AAC.1
MPGLRKHKISPLDKNQIAQAPCNPASARSAPIPNGSPETSRWQACDGAGNDKGKGKGKATEAKLLSTNTEALERKEQHNKKETHWLRRAVSPLHHKATEKKVKRGIWRVTGSIRLHIVPVRSISIFNSTPGGDKLVAYITECLRATGILCTAMFLGKFKLLLVTLQVQADQPHSAHSRYYAGVGGTHLKECYGG